MSVDKSGNYICKCPNHFLNIINRYFDINQKQTQQENTTPLPLFKTGKHLIHREGLACNMAQHKGF